MSLIVKMKELSGTAGLRRRSSERAGSAQLTDVQPGQSGGSIDRREEGGRI